MAIRTPSGITVNGVGVFVKDPNAASGSLLDNYIRIPGVGSITLPDEAAPQNDIATIDGSGRRRGILRRGYHCRPAQRGKSASNS